MRALAPIPFLVLATSSLLPHLAAAAAACAGPCDSRCARAVRPNTALYPDRDTAADCAVFLANADEDGQGYVVDLPDYVTAVCRSGEKYASACSCLWSATTTSTTAVVVTTSSMPVIELSSSSVVPEGTTSLVIPEPPTTSSEVVIPTSSAVVNPTTTTAPLPTIETTSSAEPSPSTTTSSDDAPTSTTLEPQLVATSFPRIRALDSASGTVDLKLTQQGAGYFILSWRPGYTQYAPANSASYILDPDTGRISITLSPGIDGSGATVTYWLANRNPVPGSGSAILAYFYPASSIAISTNLAYTTCTRDANGYLSCTSEGDGTPIIYAHTSMTQNVYVTRQPLAGNLISVQLQFPDGATN